MRRRRSGVLLLVAVVVQAAIVVGVGVQAIPASAATTSVLVLEAGQLRREAIYNGPAGLEVGPGELSTTYGGTLNGPGRLQVSDTCWHVLDNVHPWSAS